MNIIKCINYDNFKFKSIDFNSNLCTYPSIYPIGSVGYVKIKFAMLCNT